MGSALFGGICVTGTIARTATNVRSGAHGPVAGMLHALFLLVFMLVAAPLAAYIPLAALAGVLAVVAWNMVEKPAIAVLLRSGWGEATVLAVTFGLTVFRDLTEAIVVGLALGSLLFIQRMSKATEIRSQHGFVSEDRPDGPLRPDQPQPQDAVIYRISGRCSLAPAPASARFWTISRTAPARWWWISAPCRFWIPAGPI